MFSGGAIVPRGVSGIEYCHDLLFGRSPELEVAPIVAS
jgi:hypothetical protein